jgi:hypothetical protein
VTVTAWRPGLPPVGVVCDLAHSEEQQTMDDDGEWGAPVTVRVVWKFARVLAEVDGGDLVVQHLLDNAPRGVLPRLTRVYRAQAATFEWRPIKIPDHV